MPQSSPSNPAVEASEKALQELRKCLASKQSFVLEAGAGAGKTYSLVHVLRELIEQYGAEFPRKGRKIACITFTNVAKDEIESRTDRNPMIHCDTVHGFCWSLIAPYQKQIRAIIPRLEAWTTRLAEVSQDVPATIEYSFGYRNLHAASLSLGHDDIIPITVALLENVKFRSLLTERYPIILVDEYQDTNADWIEAIKTHFLGQDNAPLFGFFGDHWQKIYEEGCGRIIHPALTVIGKHANFRSVQPIVECLNRMRPELIQLPEDPQSTGDVIVFHTNGWNTVRRKGAHWAGDLPEELSARAFDITKQKLEERGWDFSPKKTKILMLTHRALAREQGYSSLPAIFSFNDAFAKKANKLIAYFVESLEPASDAFLQKRFGAMFEALGSKLPPVKTQIDKKAWSDAMTRLLELRSTGTVGDVVAHLRAGRRPRLPDAVEQLESDLDKINELPDGTELPRSLTELQGLHGVSYQEIIALRAYLDGYSPFETNHGVKGAQFENVLVVVGRGWSRYNFGEMLEWAASPATIATGSVDKFEQNRNLMYVACSRPKTRLAVVFTQLLTAQALATANHWFGATNVLPLSHPPN